MQGRSRCGTRLGGVAATLWMLIVPTICKYAGYRIKAWSILDLDPGWLRVVAASDRDGIIVHNVVNRR